MAGVHARMNGHTLMFERHATTGRVLRLTFDGKAIEARAGDSVAAALLAAGVGTFRETSVSGAPRAPYCMMGACFDCLVEIDGIANRQACMVAAVDGMNVRTQHGARRLG
jgi:predicted molibdopterin-dependent oxidoreductase YjgC